MGPHLLASELMKEKSGETNERKLNTESYLVPRVTNPTGETESRAKLLQSFTNTGWRSMSLAYLLYVRRNSGDIDDRE